MEATKDDVLYDEYVMLRLRNVSADRALQVLCAGSAIVQGMDQSAVNGAQAFYFPYFGIGDDQVWLQGLINGAPYLCSAVIGCWSTKPLNYYLGRRGTIFISCIISVVTGIWMGAVDQ